MTLYRRKGSKIWQYDFYKSGKRFQGTTGVKNKRDALDIENTLKTDIAKAKFGLAPPKQSPPLAEFLEGKFLDHVDRHAKVKSTAKAYRERVTRLLRWPKWRDMPLSQITGDVINGFIGFRSARSNTRTPDNRAGSIDKVPSVKVTTRASISIAGLNAELATLRKALNLAEEWGLCQRIKVRLLPGAKGRDFVVSPQLEAEYLEAAVYPLQQVSTLMLDCGIRPEECVSLRKSDILPSASQPETLRIRHGKSQNAARTLPLTQRAMQVIELLSALFPDSEWLFKGYKGHMTAKHITNLHEDLRDEKGWPREFVLYSWRHTAATRLADSGATPFELMAYLGHSDIKMVARYVHADPGNLRVALKRREMMERLMREGHEDVSTVKN